MVIVVISVRYKRILEILSEYKNYHLIKRIGPKMFFYVEGDVTHLTSKTKKLILNVLGVMSVVEVYGMYNGMIDFTTYLSDEKKNESQYYNSTVKDLSDDELKDWKNAYMK